VEWVQRHLPEVAHKRLILSHHKHLNRGHYLVDAREANGADRFEGELIRFGSARFPGWAAVTEYLLA
jgi:5'(3')-deoxyribonucleotidase